MLCIIIIIIITAMLYCVAGCDAPLGLGDDSKLIATDQLLASSTAADLQIGFARFNCCSGRLCMCCLDLVS